jgi:RNA polymerase sigma factor (sigma-70 family)
VSQTLTPELLSRLLDEHGGALVLFAAQWTDSPDDCVQEAFIELTRQPELPHCLAAWLYRVTRNKAISMSRSAWRRRRHETLAAALIPAWTCEEDRPPVEREELAAALQSLDEELREVIVARIWGGLNFGQIAEAVGTSSSTAHRRYETGLAALRERLGLICPAKKTTGNCPAK